MKRCFRCKEWKPLEGFNKNKTTPDGLQNQCRECQKLTYKAYSQSEKGKQVKKAQAKQYKESGKRNEVQYRYNHSEKNRQAQRRYYKSERGRAINYKNRNISRAMFPEKDKARKAVSRAVEKGKMPKAIAQKCTQCGNQAHEYHHYKGYDRKHWLNVIPLCRICHRAIDQRNLHSSYSTR